MTPKLFLPPLFCSLGLSVLCAQTGTEARATNNTPRKRAPLLLAEQALAGVAPEVKARALAKAKGRPVIPKGKRRYLVHLREEADPAAFAKGRGIACERTFVHAIKMFVACLDDAEVEALRDAQMVEGIEEDRYIGEMSAQAIPSGVKRMAVEQFPTAKIDGLDERIDVDVAVIDGGVQPDHPDLNVYRTFSTFGTFVAEPHGTSSAGVIGALDNEYGTVGVAPGVRIWSVRLPEGGTYLGDWTRAFEYVAEHADEIEVANCSIGTLSDTLRNSLEAQIMAMVNKGVVVVASAGNSSKDIAGANGVLDDGEITDNILPAALPGVMAVSAMDPIRGTMAGYSNFSASNHLNRVVVSPGAAIDVSAPGNSVGTTLPGSAYSPGGYSGTSCACPHAAGLVALYIATHGRAYDAAGVYRIRQAVVDAAQPQSEWNSGEIRDRDSKHEGLARASVEWATNSPKVTRFSCDETTARIDFTTLSGYRHVLQSSESLGDQSPWQSMMEIDGDGGISSLVDPRNGALRKFYRVSTNPLTWPVFDPEPAVNLGTLGTSGNGAYYEVTRGLPGALAGDASNRAIGNVLGGSHTAVPYSSALNPVGPFSLEIWVKPSLNVNTGEYWYLPGIAGSLSSTNSGWWIYQGAGNSGGDFNGFSAFFHFGGTTYLKASVSLSIDTSKWYHLVVTFDGPSINLYVDGALRQSTPTSGHTFVPNFDRELRWGSANSSWFPGSLDEAAIYPHALTAAQVLAHYQAGTSPTPPIPYPQVILADNPAGYWRFNEP